MITLRGCVDPIVEKQVARKHRSNCRVVEVRVAVVVVVIMVGGGGIFVPCEC